jgi:prolyl-tRNA synthetase
LTKQCFDGIIFPASIAPFFVVIVPINYNKSTRVKNLADNLYQQYLDAGIEVLLVFSMRAKRNINFESQCCGNKYCSQIILILIE